MIQMKQIGLTLKAKTKTSIIATARIGSCGSITAGLKWLPSLLTPGDNDRELLEKAQQIPDSLVSVFVCLTVMKEITSDSSATQHLQKKELLLILKLLGEGRAHLRSSIHALAEALVQALYKEEPLGATFFPFSSRKKWDALRWDEAG